MSKPFTVNTNRYDPYKSYRFLVYFGTNTTAVAGVSKVGGLKRSSDPIEYKEGGNAIILKGLGRTKYDAITLERGRVQQGNFHNYDMLRIDEMPHVEVHLVESHAAPGGIGGAEFVFGLLYERLGYPATELDRIPRLRVGGKAVLHGGRRHQRDLWAVHDEDLAVDVLGRRRRQELHQSHHVLR